MKYMDNLSLKSLSVLMVALLFSACSRGLLIIEGKDGSAKVIVNEGDRNDRHKGPKIPPGHMPPPGSCRIWYPNTPPGQQLPSGDCHRLARQVPPGAWLIRG